MSPWSPTAFDCQSHDCSVSCVSSCLESSCCRRCRRRCRGPGWGWMSPCSVRSGIQPLPCTGVSSGGHAEASRQGRYQDPVVVFLSTAAAVVSAAAAYTSLSRSGQCAQLIRAACRLMALRGVRPTLDCRMRFQMHKQSLQNQSADHPCLSKRG
jgi:hypothetical protein